MQKVYFVNVSASHALEGVVRVVREYRAQPVALRAAPPARRATGVQVADGGRCHVDTSSFKFSCVIALLSTVDEPFLRCITKGKCDTLCSRKKS